MQKVQLKNPSFKSLFDIKTYYSLQNVLSALKRVDSELHVFGTDPVANKSSTKYNLHTMSIDGLNRRVFPEYHSIKYEVYLQSKLRNFILNGHFTHQKYLLNRLSLIVQTFRFFAEISIEHIPTKDDNTRKNEMIELINYLLKKESFKDYSTRKASLTKQEISTLLTGHDRLQNIYFYEIDYLNFFRMSLIYWLKFKGFHIQLRVPYDKRFPETYSYWQDVYQIATKQDLSLCQSLDSLLDVTYGSHFSFFNENKKIELNDRNDVELIQFTSPYSFYNYYAKNEDTFLAINPKEVSTIVDHSKSTVYKDRIGKFIYFIQFCEHKNGKIYLNYNVLTELITSGLIETNHISGIKALGLLIDLRDYMMNVETTEDVISRLKKLQQLEFVSKTFDKENTEDTGNNMMKKYMLNPFRTISYIHQERYDVTTNQLIALVKQLERICFNLVIKNRETQNVNRYFSLWNQYLQRIDEIENKQFWSKVFSEKFPHDWEFAFEELLSLIYITVSNKYKEPSKIYDLQRLQEILLRETKDKTLHLTNMTLLNFPESHKSPISEFFTYTELKESVRLIENKRLQNIFIHSLWVDYTVSTQFEKLGLYQMYSMLRFHEGPLKFSWINFQDDSIRSVYLDLLANLYTDSEIVEYNNNDDENEFNVCEDRIKNIKPNIAVMKFKGKIPDLFWLDHDFCAKKFFLTTFIEKQPIYDSDFHIQFVFSKLGKLFSYSKFERQQVRDLLYPLFPHWTPTKKDNLIDMEYKVFLRDYRTFENISYPKEMRGFQTLRSIYRENRRTKARNQYRKNSLYNERDLLQKFNEQIDKYNVKAEPGNHCKMCPHLNSCIEGVYSIDSRN